MTQRFQIVILIVLTVTIYIATAGRPSLLDDADASHAMAAHAMLERGDWAVLHMNGMDRVGEWAIALENAQALSRGGSAR